MEVVLGVVAARDAGLVGDDEDAAVHAARMAHQVEDAVDELEVLDAVHVGVIDVDHPVPVEEQRRLHGRHRACRCASISSVAARVLPTNSARRW